MAFLLGGSVRSVVIIAMVLTSMQSIGLDLASRLDGRLSDFVRSSLGFLFMSVLVVETNQQLLNRFELSLPWWGLPMASLVMAVSSSRRPIPRNAPMPALGNHPITIYGAAVALCSFTYYWLLPVALAILTLLIFRVDTISWKVKVIGTASTIAALSTLAVAMRPRYWALIAEEQVFYALVSSSLGHFPSTIFSFSTTGGITYHWLTYGLTGWMSREAQFDIMPLMSVILPVLFTALAFGLVVSVFKIESISIARQLIAVAAICLFLYRIGPWGGAKVLEWHLSPSQPASLAFCLGFLVLISTPSRITSVNLLFIGLLAYGAVGSYITTSIAPIVGSAVTVSVSLLPKFTRSIRNRSCVLGCVIALGAAISLYRFFRFPFGSQPGQVRLGLLPFLGFIGTWNGEITSLVGLDSLLARVGFLLGISAPLILASIVSFDHYPPFLIRCIRGIMVSGIVGALVIQSEYFAAQLVILTSTYVLAVPYLAIGYLSSVERQTSTYLAVLWGLVSWWVWYRVFNTAQEIGGVSGIRFRNYLQAFPAVVAFLYCAVAVMVAIVRGSENHRFGLATTLKRKTLHPTVGALLVFSCLQGLYGFHEGYKYYNWRYETRGELLNPSPSTVGIARWIAANTTQSDLFAVDRADSGLELQNLFMLSGRRLLVPGPRLWERDFRNEQGGARLLKIQNQLNDPTPSLVAELREVNVTHVLLRERDSKEQFLKLLGEPLFRNVEWTVYRILNCPERPTLASHISRCS